MSKNGEYRARPRWPAGASIEGLSDHERLIRWLLDNPAKREALTWLVKGGPENRRTLGECKSAKQSAALVKEIYRAGAVEVFAVDIKSDANGSQHTGKLVVAMPQRPQVRKAIFEWCKGQGEALGFSPEQDSGEKYMFLLLD